MYYVVGLGNPGEKYKYNRHNIGFMVVDAFCVMQKFPTPLTDKKFSGQVTFGMVGEESVTVLYPDTFMNHSGSAVVKLVPKGEVEKLIVVYDDIALPFGVVRVAFGRGSGGHNGVDSVATALGTKCFVRVRVGIGQVGFWPWEDKQRVRRPAGDALPKYVLGNFSIRERLKLDALCTHTATVIADCIVYGHVQAMNIHNYVEKSK